MSRYYDPEISQFISPDTQDYLKPETIGGVDLYAYCENNPVIHVDPTGHFSGLIFQFLVSAISYIGIAIASIFDEEIREDMNAIGWNPFNSNADVVVSDEVKKVSFYKGVPVFKIDDMGGSISLGAIGLYKYHSAEVLKHERGHNTQLMVLGLKKYLMFIGIPSFIGAKLASSGETEMGKWIAKNYHSLPWERSADLFGGANFDNLPYSNTIAMVYFILSLIF